MGYSNLSSGMKYKKAGGKITPETAIWIECHEIYLKGTLLRKEGILKAKISGAGLASRRDTKSALLIVFGMAFYWTTVDITRNDYFIFLQTQSNNDVFATLCAYCVILAILGLVAFKNRAYLERVLEDKSWFVPSLSIIASFGALLFLSPRLEQDILFWIARIGASIFLILWFMVMTFAWGRTIIQESARSGMVIPALSFTIGVGISLLNLLPQPVGNTLLVITPLITGVFWQQSSKPNLTPPSLSVSNLQNAQIPTFVICGTFFCASAFARDLVSYSNSHEVASSFEMQTATAASLACALVLLIALTISSRSKSPNHTFIVAWAVAAVVFFGCLFTLAIGIAPGNKGGEGFLAACFMCFKLLLWIFTASVARNSQVSSVTAFSVFYLSFAVVMLAAVGIILPASLQISSATFFTYLQEILLFLAFILIIASFIFFVRYAPSKNDAIIDSVKNTPRFDTLSRIGDQKGLTARELEIALLIAQGYSAKYIAEMLYVSQETIRTHSKRIYKKLGIHSKQEIIELANEQ